MFLQQNVKNKNKTRKEILKTLVIPSPGNTAFHIQSTYLSPSILEHMYVRL